ncbi:MAG TPA: hypothetical protein VMW73_05725 [Spirochaetia bacterium]|nr:hypothetical protein [Spirochaetia bacterium]
METVSVLYDPFADRTFMHPAIAVFILLACAAALVSGRNRALIAAMLTLNFIPAAQRLYLVGMNLPAIRIFIFAAILRIVIRNEYVHLRLNNLDRIVAAYGISTVITYTLQVPSAGSLNYAMGSALDALGAYFIVRVLVRDGDNLRCLVETLAGVSIVIVLLFLYEYRTGVNPMNVFGGVPATSDIRGGRIRIQGPYPHSILAGAYWAAALPLFIGYRLREGLRVPVMYLAAFASLVVVVLSASSTPIASAAFGVAGAVLYYQRRSLTALKLSLLLTLLVIALVMHHPIWFLLARVDLVGGSTGYYRYLLVDSFLRHWSDWCLIGIRDTFQWGEGYGLAAVGLRDLANQFVYEGTRGGAASLLLFVSAIVTSLGYIGVVTRSAVANDERRYAWSVGVSLLVHVASFVAVSYYGQVKFAWWMTVALCGSLYQRHVEQYAHEFGDVLAGEPS